MKRKKLVIICIFALVVIAAVAVFIITSKNNGDNQNGIDPSPNISPSAEVSLSPDISEEPVFDKTTFLDEDFEPTKIEKVQRTYLKTINPNISSFTFTLRGLYGLDEKTKISEVTVYEIEITSNNNAFTQKLAPLKTWSNSAGKVEIPEKDLTFEDWNHDGFLDIALHISDGGTMGNHPQRFWLWDGSKGKFVENEQLSEISDMAGIYIAEDGRTASHTKTGPGSYQTIYYEYKNGSFLTAEMHIVETRVDENGSENVYEEISKIINDELQVISRTVNGQEIQD